MSSTCLECGTPIQSNPIPGCFTYANRGLCRKCARKNRRRLAKVEYRKRKEAGGHASPVRIIITRIQAKVEYWKNKEARKKVFP